MSLEIAKQTDPMKILAIQTKHFMQQENDGVPARSLKIRCTCLKLVRWAYMYRCLYCGIFYCRECAEAHFGKTIDEYRAEKALNCTSGVN